MKAERQRRIVQVLRAHPVTSQEELAKFLARRGERATQATLSRDLEELGAFKARQPGGRVAYCLPDEPPQANGERLRRMLVEFALEIEASANMVVVKTPPGCAHPVARALDTSAARGILGTVAGDDTILIVCRDGVAGDEVARRLRRAAGQFGDMETGTRRGGAPRGRKGA
ncbi:MAG: arginine repressor [Acidobacteria bacterium]|nr:arginine repressor [Acidobacteriota bacterium]